MALKGVYNMLESVNELNIDVAVLYASNKCERDEQDINYEEMVQTDEYILISDPIKRIADMNY